MGAVNKSDRKARRRQGATKPYDPDDLLRRMLNVQADMERDGWGPAMRARDALPDDWHPTAEGLRFLWWRDYGLPDWYAPDGEPAPKPEPAVTAGIPPLGLRLRRRPVVVPEPTTLRERLASAGTVALIIGGALVWAAILDGVVGLDTLRRLLGWNLY